jgi:hypothetical protein
VAPQSEHDLITVSAPGSPARRHRAIDGARSSHTELIVGARSPPDVGAPHNQLPHRRNFPHQRTNAPTQQGEHP